MRSRVSEPLKKFRVVRQDKREPFLDPTPVLVSFHNELGSLQKESTLRNVLGCCNSFELAVEVFGNAHVEGHVAIVPFWYRARQGGDVAYCRSLRGVCQGLGEDSGGRPCARVVWKETFRQG